MRIFCEFFKIIFLLIKIGNLLKGFKVSKGFILCLFFKKLMGLIFKFK